MYRFLLVFVFGLGLVSPAFAWGPNGHRITGAIADPLLSEAARTQVQQILGVEDLAEISTWADEMRSNPDPFWQRQASPWHYVTIPEGKTYSEVGAPQQGDAMTALQHFTRLAKDTSLPRSDRAQALKFVVHIIADLHQPLHTGNGRDRGGNRFNVVFFDELTNLHAVWDYGMIDHQQLSFTEKSNWLNRKIRPAQIEEWTTTDPLVWIAESIALRDTIYPEDQVLSWQYSYDYMPQVDRRLSQSGVRIAAYLNEMFEVEEQ
jgi:hypothetical protein